MSQLKTLQLWETNIGGGRNTIHTSSHHIYNYHDNYNDNDIENENENDDGDGDDINTVNINIDSSNGNKERYFEHNEHRDIIEEEEEEEGIMKKQYLEELNERRGCLSAISHLKNLTVLNLRDTKANDDDIACIQHLEQLTNLNLDRTFISDKGNDTLCMLH